MAYSKPIHQTRNYLCLEARELLFATVLWLHSVIQCCLHCILHFFPFYPLNVAIDCLIILDKVFWHNLLFYDCMRYFYISWSHTQCQRDRDMSTLLLAIISLKHITAYSGPYTQHRRLLYYSNCSLTIQKNCGFYVHAVLVVSVGRLSRRLAEFFFRPASRGLAKSTAA